MPLLRIETEPRRAEPKPAEEDAKQDNLDLTSLPPIPQWGLRDPAAAPETETPWSLEVIKNGTVVDTCELPASQRGRYVLGRAKERVHVHLEHASISRLHGARARARATRPRVDLSTEPCPPPARSAAVLQHSTDGKLFAFDMNSAHGTHLNKARMPACGFVEVKDGDVLVFGESTRVYVLHGPAAASDAATGNVAFGAAVPTREKDKRRVVGFSAGALAAADGAAPAAADGAALRSRLGEADWGLAIDADDATAADSEREAERAAAMRGPDDSGEGASDEQLPDYLKNDPLFRKYRTASASVGEKEVHERDLKLFEKLQAKITKMNNIQNENKRILAKARASARARAPPPPSRATKPCPLPPRHRTRPRVGSAMGSARPSRATMSGWRTSRCRSKNSRTRSGRRTGSAPTARTRARGTARAPSRPRAMTTTISTTALRAETTRAERIGASRGSSAASAVAARRGTTRSLRRPLKPRRAWRRGTRSSSSVSQPRRPSSTASTHHPTPTPARMVPRRGAPTRSTTL